MVILRMFALEKIFTKQELTALDDIVPSFRSVVSAGKRSKEGRWHFIGLIQKKNLKQGATSSAMIMILMVSGLRNLCSKSLMMTKNFALPNNDSFFKNAYALIQQFDRCVMFFMVEKIVLLK